MAEERLDRRFEKPIAFLVLVVGLGGGGIPIFSQIFGYPFSPSVEYYEASSPFRILFGLGAGAFIFYLTLATDFFERRKNSGLDRSKHPLKWMLFLIFGPVLFGTTANMFVVFTIPMTLAVAAGGHIELTYEVRDPTASNSRYCRSKVTLKSMPWYGGDVCGVGESFRSRLRPGMKVALGGWGTAQGLFYNEISIVDETHNQ